MASCADHFCPLGIALPPVPQGYEHVLVCATGPLVLQPFKFPSDLVPGEDATFRCLVRSGEAPYDFRWRKDGSEASQSERLFSTVVTERLATLTVRRVVLEDSANYTCVVSDVTGAEAAVQASLTISGNYDHGFIRRKRCFQEGGFQAFIEFSARQSCLCKRKGTGFCHALIH